MKNIILSQDHFVLRFLVAEFTQGLDKMTLEKCQRSHI